MLEQPIRHLVEHEADVLEADLLPDDVAGQGRKALVHSAHHARQHSAVADPGVENANGGRPRIDIAQFHRDPLRDDPLLATGIDEQQVFLSVVVEAENRLTSRSGAVFIAMTAVSTTDPLGLKKSNHRSIDVAGL